MEKRYLINNKIYGSSTEMPNRQNYGLTSAFEASYNYWQQSLTELACDESELDKIKNYCLKEVYKGNITTTNNIDFDITSITTVKDDKVYFKEMESFNNISEVQSDMLKKEAIKFLEWVWLNKYTDNNDADELYEIFKNK